MKINKQLVISDKINTSFVVDLNCNSDDGKVLLQLTNSQFDKIEISGHNFFDCLLKARQELEKKGLYLLCLGSARNVYPSRMSSQMSNGLKAYRLQFGKQAELADLVNIFEESTIEDVVTINEQRIFFENWIKSLK